MPAPALDVVVAHAASGRYHIKAAPRDYCLIASDNRDPADITPSTPGWTPSAPADGRLSISISNADLRNRDLGLYRGLILKGRVFRDTGTPDARPATPPTTASRTARNLACRASACASRPAAASIPAARPMPTAPTRCSCPCRRTAAAAGQPIEVAQTNPQGHVSTGASVQGKPISGSASVGGTHTYDRDADILSFAPGGRSVLDGLDFGDVPDSRLSHDGNLDGTPGAALTFPHVFTAGTRGSLRLSSSAVPSPPAENWTDALYRDINCNGQIDVDTDTLIPSEQVFDLDAGQNLCLVHKQFIPANAATGHRNVVTLRAELTYANAAPAQRRLYARGPDHGGPIRRAGTGEGGAPHRPQLRAAALAAGRLGQQQSGASRRLAAIPHHVPQQEHRSLAQPGHHRRHAGLHPLRQRNLRHQHA